VDTDEPNNDQLPELLAICEHFFASTGADTRHELDALLQARGITGGPGWLIDMLALERRRLQPAERGIPT
jgi:hypothetical protein